MSAEEVDPSRGASSSQSGQKAASDVPSFEYKPFPTDEKGGFSAFKKWLGPKGYKQFQNTLCQGIVQQIGKDKKKMKEASDRLKRSSTTGDLYE